MVRWQKLPTASPRRVRCLSDSCPHQGHISSATHWVWNWTPAHLHFSLFHFSISSSSLRYLLLIPVFCEPFHTRLMCSYWQFVSTCHFGIWPRPHSPLPLVIRRILNCLMLRVFRRHPRSPLLRHIAPDCPELSPHMHPPDSATSDTDFYFLPDFDLAHSCSFPRHSQQPAHPGPSRHSPEPSTRPSSMRYPHYQWEQHLHSE